MEVVGRIYPCCRPVSFTVRKGCKLLLAVVGQVLCGRKGDRPGSSTRASEEAPCEEGKGENHDRAGDDSDDNDGRGGEPGAAVPPDDVGDMGHYPEE